jgi:hypothetical protein
MNYSSNKLRALAIAALLFSAVSASAIEPDNIISSVSSLLDTDTNVTTPSTAEVIDTVKENIGALVDPNEIPAP